MKMLPVTPVETLAPLRAATTIQPANTGIVPPWMQDGGNTGIVPPWLEGPTVPVPGPGRNPGIVPPWLQDRPVAPTTPVPDDVPRILGGAKPTGFDPTPIVVDDQTPRIWQG